MRAPPLPTSCSVILCCAHAYHLLSPPPSQHHHHFSLSCHDKDGNHNQHQNCQDYQDSHYCYQHHHQAIIMPQRSDVEGGTGLAPITLLFLLFSSSYLEPRCKVFRDNSTLFLVFCVVVFRTYRYRFRRTNDITLLASEAMLRYVRTRRQTG